MRHVPTSEERKIIRKCACMMTANGERQCRSPKLASMCLFVTRLTRAIGMINHCLSFTKQERGNLTQLKRAGLLRTIREDDGNEFVLFTKAGAELAKQNGYEVRATV